MRGLFRNAVVMLVFFALLGAGFSIPVAYGEVEGGFETVTVNSGGGSDDTAQNAMIGLLVVVIGILLYLGVRSDQRRSEAAKRYQYASADDEERTITMTPTGLCARF